MSSIIDNRRAKLSEYVPWIARDYFTNQGPSTAIVILLIAVMSMETYSMSTGLRLASMPVEIAARLLRGLVGTLVFLGTFFATNGIVANDRKQGTYKFLFAKPVSPPRYYATVFAVYGVGLVVVTLALLGVWAIIVRPMFPPELFVIVFAMYLAYGGIGFLLSAAFRYDWMSLVTVFLVAKVAWSWWADVSGPRHWLLYLLPPVHLADSVYAVVLRDSSTAIPWGAFAWLVGYGLACFVVGILVIRKRPLGTS